MGSLSLLQQIVLTEESSQGLLHCRWILYQLSYKGSPVSSLCISNFLELISSLFHSTVFFYFFALITEEGFSYLSLLFFGTLHFFFLLSFALASLLFSAICKISSDNHFAFLHFFFLEMVFIMPPVQCCELLFIVLQALCLSDLGSEISI